MGSATWQAGKAMKSCSPCYAWDPKTWSMAQISHSSIVIFRSDGCIIRAGRKLLAKRCIENIGGVEHMYTCISFANLLAPHKPISSLCQRQIQKTPGQTRRHSGVVAVWAALRCARSPRRWNAAGAETRMLASPHHTHGLLLTGFPPHTQQRNLVSNTQVAPVLLGAMGSPQNRLSKLSPLHCVGPARGEQCPPVLGMKSVGPKPAAAF